MSLGRSSVPDLRRRLAVMDRLIEHRGPDDHGTWTDESAGVGLVHRRLSVIDPSPAGHQPMIGHDGSVVVFNGEIYNYRELRSPLAAAWPFRSSTDTEVLLASFARDGEKCLDHLRGMFAFAVWDGGRLVCARDHFGIKPLYYTVADGAFHFASEIKALLPFVPEIATDEEALAEYLVFQFTIGAKTMFRGIQQLLPGHALRVEDGRVSAWRYWDVHYEVDFDHSPRYFEARTGDLLAESVDLHLRSDVPVGSYVSGGIDSTLIAVLAAGKPEYSGLAFHGRFTDYPGYDESRFAEIAAEASKSRLHVRTITADDFLLNVERMIYHLDEPVAGPGAFAQFMVSGLAAEHVKVVLGGQGGDEVFGGYARYLIAYLEQCLRAAIDGTYQEGNFVVTAESIIPNLTVLQEYTPLIKQFWSEGLFGPLDERYFRLIDRSAEMTDEVDWEQIDKPRVVESFKEIFNSARNVSHEAYFDSMTHFDFKTLLPALLHVEDRMSMAHGLEARVPILDKELIEFASTVPADVKFQDGRMKHLLKQAFPDVLPPAVRDRRDKMGFPVPLAEWFADDLRDWVNDVFRSPEARARPFVNTTEVVRRLDASSRFGRKTWALLSLELWQRTFHDKAAHYRQLLQVGETSEEFT